MANALPHKRLQCHDGWDSSRSALPLPISRGLHPMSFTTWQGSGLLAPDQSRSSLRLNIQQHGLRRPPTDTAARVAPARWHAGRPAEANDELLKAYPELRPLRLGRTGRWRCIRAGGCSDERANAMPSAGGAAGLQLAETTGIDLSSGKRRAHAFGQAAGGETGCCRCKCRRIS